MSRYGVKLEEETLVRKVRRIPAKGEVFVNVGDVVESETVIVSGTVRNPEAMEVNVSAKLGVDPDQIERYMLKKEGEAVVKDEVIAIFRAFFGALTKTCRSPMDGFIDVLLRKAGRVIIRGHPIPVEAKAHIPGRILEVIPGEGAVVESRGALINGVFGVGGEARGDLIFAVDQPREALTTEVMEERYKGKILVGGSIVTLDALRKSAEMGIRGIITGGVDQKDLIDFLGQEIGVGVTGTEEVGLTLIVTEGFGIYPMQDETFRLLKSHEGKQTSIDGTTQIRQMMLRPEIFVPIQ
ncbi:MAG: hypothetical protein JSV18_07835 [Candidatus Bathyarchaeota archaeon]|nr:MAG: hypothetical protein JSV18_07835 [Candidatus Bathyarchaeota archaeon]